MTLIKEQSAGAEVNINEAFYGPLQLPAIIPQKGVSRESVHGQKPLLQGRNSRI